MASFARRFLIMASASLRPDSVASVKQTIYTTQTSKRNDASRGVFDELESGPSASQPVPGKRFMLQSVMPGLTDHNESFYTGTQLSTQYSYLSNTLMTNQAAAVTVMVRDDNAAYGKMTEVGRDPVRLMKEGAPKGNIALRLSGSGKTVSEGSIAIVKGGALGNSRWTFSESRTVRFGNDSPANQRFNHAGANKSQYVSSIEPGDAQVMQSPLIFGKAADIITSSDEQSFGINEDTCSGFKRYVNRPKLLPLKDGRLMLIYISTSELPAHHWYLAGYNPSLRKEQFYVPTYPIGNPSGQTSPTYSTDLGSKLVVSFMDPDTEKWSAPKELNLKNGLPVTGPRSPFNINDSYNLMVADIAQDPVTDEIVIMFCVNLLGEWGDKPTFTPSEPAASTEGFITTPSSTYASNQRVADAWTYSTKSHALHGGFSTNCKDKVIYVASSKDGEKWALRSQHNCHPPATADIESLRRPSARNNSIPGVTDPVDYSPYIGGAIEFLPSGRLLAIVCSARTIYHMRSDDRGETFTGGTLFDSGQFHAAQVRPPSPDEPNVDMPYVTPIHGDCYYLYNFVDTVRQADIAIMEDGSAVVVATHTFPTYGKKPVAEPEVIQGATFSDINLQATQSVEWYFPGHWFGWPVQFNQNPEQADLGIAQDRLQNYNFRDMMVYLDACVRHTSIWVTVDGEHFKTDPSVGGIDAGQVLGSQVFDNQIQNPSVKRAVEATPTPADNPNPYFWNTMDTDQRQGIGPTGWGLSGNRINAPDPTGGPAEATSFGDYPYYLHNRAVYGYDRYMYGCTPNAIIPEKAGPECIEPAVVLRPDGFGQVYATTHNWATPQNYENSLVDLTWNRPGGTAGTTGAQDNLTQYMTSGPAVNVWAAFYDERNSGNTPSAPNVLYRFWAAMQISGAMFNTQHKGTNIWNPCFNAICGRTLATRTPGSTAGTQEELLPEEWSKDINAQASSSISTGFPYNTPDSYTPAVNADVHNRAYMYNVYTNLAFDFRRALAVSPAHIMVSGYQNVVETTPAAPTFNESMMNQSAQGRLFPVLDVVHRRSLMLTDGLQAAATAGYVGIAAAQWKGQVVTVAAYCKQGLHYTQTPYIPRQGTQVAWQPSAFAPVPPLYEGYKYSTDKPSQSAYLNDASALVALRTSYWTPLVENLCPLNLETGVGTNISWRDHLRFYTFWTGEPDDGFKGRWQIGYCSNREQPPLTTLPPYNNNATIDGMRSSGHEIALSLVFGKIYNRVYDAVQVPDRLLWQKIQPRKDLDCPEAENNCTIENNAMDGGIVTVANQDPQATTVSYQDKVAKDGGAFVVGSIAGGNGSGYTTDGGRAYRLVSHRFQKGYRTQNRDVWNGVVSGSNINEDVVDYSSIFQHGRHSLPHPCGQDTARAYSQTAGAAGFPTTVDKSNRFSTGLCGMFRAICAPLAGGNVGFYSPSALTVNSARNAESIWIKLILEDTESNNINSGYEGARAGIQVLMERASSTKVRVAVVDPFALYMKQYYAAAGTGLTGQNCWDIPGSNPVEIEVDDPDWNGWIEIVAGIQGRDASGPGYALNPPSTGSNDPYQSSGKTVQAFCFVRPLKHAQDTDGIGPFQTVCLQGVAPAIWKQSFPDIMEPTESQPSTDPDGRMAECLEFGVCGGLAMDSSVPPTQMVARNAYMALKTLQLHRSTTTPMIDGMTSVHTGGFEVSIKGEIGDPKLTAFEQQTNMIDNGMGSAYSGAAAPMAFKYLWMTDGTDTTSSRYYGVQGATIVRAGTELSSSGTSSVPALIPDRILSENGTTSYQIGSPFFRNVSDETLQRVDSGITNAPCPPMTKWYAFSLYGGLKATFTGEAESTGCYAFFPGYDAPVSATTSLPVAREWRTGQGRLTDDSWHTPIRIADVRTSASVRYSRIVREPTVYDCPPVEILFDAFGEAGYGTTGDRYADLTTATRKKFNPKGMAVFGKNWTGCTLFLCDDLDGLDSPEAWDDSSWPRYSFGLPGDGMLRSSGALDGGTWSNNDPDRYIDLWSWTPYKDIRTGYAPTVIPIAPYTRNFPRVGPFSFTFRKNIEPTNVPAGYQRENVQNTSVGPDFPANNNMYHLMGMPRVERDRENADIEKHTPWRPHQFKSKKNGPQFYLRLIINSVRTIPSELSDEGNSISQGDADPTEWGPHKAAYVYRIIDNDEQTLTLESNPELQGFNEVEPTLVDGHSSSPPASPAHGSKYLIAGAGADAWAGHGGEIATNTGGDVAPNWFFQAPSIGQQVAVVPNSNAIGAPQLWYGPDLSSVDNSPSWQGYSYQIDAASIFSDRFACLLPANAPAMLSTEQLEEADMKRLRNPGEGYRYMRLVIHGSMRASKDDGFHRCGRIVIGDVVELSGPDFEWGWSRQEQSGTNLVTTRGGPRYSRVEHAPRRVFNVQHHPLPSASTPSKQVWGGGGVEDYGPNSVTNNPDGARGWGASTPGGWTMRPRTWNEVVELARALDISSVGAALVFEGTRALSTYQYGLNLFRNATQAESDPESVMMVRMTKIGSIKHETYMSQKVKVQPNSTAQTRNDGATPVNTYMDEQCTPKPVMTISSIELEEEF